MVIDIESSATIIDVLNITIHKKLVCAAWHSGYHPQTSVPEIKHRPRGIVLGWGTKMVEQISQELELIT